MINRQCLTFMLTAALAITVLASDSVVHAARVGPKADRWTVHNPNPKTSRADTLGLLQVEDQQKAMTGLFTIARNRYASGALGTDLTRDEARQVAHQVEIVERHASTTEAKENLLYLLARTCEDYYLASTGGPGNVNYSYQMVFQYAMDDACERLSKFPGDKVHLALVDIKKQWGEDSASPLNDYIASQSKLSGK